ncbi:MAG: type II toxin-antitoxin system VapC family toxin [Thermoplasmata archaeon]
MEKPDSIILDASVVIKWFVDEEYTDKAIEILNDYRKGETTIYSVQLMPYEVMNALRYNSTLGKQDLILIGSALKKFQIELYPLVDGLYESTIDIAINSGTTIFDASYLALAIEMNGHAYTADKRFADKVAEYGHLSHISSYK